MRTSISSVAVASLFVAGGVAVFAQWPSYPTGVPKTPDGKPDLTAPTPRTADGKPDFSGTWGLGGGGGRGRGGQQAKGASPTPAPPAPSAAATGPADAPPSGQFFNIGAGFKDGQLPFQP